MKPTASEPYAFAIERFGCRFFTAALSFLLSASVAFAETSVAERAPLNPKASPSLRQIVDVPGLPRVLLIGDSISLGYTVRVREALKGKANVHRAPTNCGPTKKGVAEIDTWLGTGRWDVVHFNFGLHDIRLIRTNVLQVPPKEYEMNLRKLVERLKRTEAALIWATTTPAPVEPRAGQFRRIPSDVVAYNQIAAQVMKEHGIATVDLYSAVVERTAELQPVGDVHFNSKGYDVLAEKVASAIAALLPASGK